MTGFQFDPGTGAIDPGRLVTPDAAGPAQLGPSGIAGNPGAPQQDFMGRAAPVADVDSRTLDALIDISQGLLAEPIAKRQEEMYLRGVARAAQGEAVRDIVQEQPAWARIFGKSSTAKGALAFEKMRVSNERMVDVQNNMQEYRTMTPAEFEQRMGSEINAWRTGDNDVDMAVQAHWIEQLPKVYSVQAKEHYQYVQEMNYNSKRASADSFADLLQAHGRAYVDGKLSAEDLESAKIGAVQEVFALPPDMDAETRSRYIMDTMQKQMSENKHRLVAAMFNYGKPLLEKYLSVEDRAKLEDWRDKYEKRTLDEFGSLHMAEQVGVLRGRAEAGTISPADIAEATKRINADFRRRYDVERDYITPDQLTSLVANTTAAGIRAMREAAAERRKARQEQDLENVRLVQIQQLVVAGKSLAAAAAEGRERVELSESQIFDMQWVQGIDPAMDLLYRNFANNRWVNGILRDRFQQGLNTSLQEGYGGKTFEDSLAMWRAMRSKGGNLMAAAYFGEGNHRALSRYDVLYKRLGPEMAFANAFGVNQTVPVRASEDALKAVDAAAEDTLDPGWWARTFNGAYPMSEQGRTLLRQQLGPVVQQRHNLMGGPMNELAREELELATLSYDVLGGFVFNRGGKQKPLTEKLGVTGEELGDTINYALAVQMARSGIPSNAHPNYTQLKNRLNGGEAVDKLFKGIKFWPGEVKIMAVRGQDVNGDASLVFNVYDSDGNVKIIRLNEKQLVDAHAEVRNFKRKPK